jgi:dihydroorotate dehydrogenase (fumarate)
MGVALANPIVVGACSLSKKIDTIRQIEDAGAGGLVIKSLFEEQIQHERGVFEDGMTRYDDMFSEAVSMFPHYEHGGARQHLTWVKETRDAVKMPLFASLNAVERETWIEYAKELEDTGVDGLELNFYSPPLDRNIPAGDIEKQEVDTLAAVVAAVSIPVAVKLHPYYTSLLNHAKNLDETGVEALVLFNRLFEPDVDLSKEAKKATLHLSSSDDSRVPLRWTALLSGQTKCDLIASTGIMSGQDVAKMLLAGAQAVQVASAVFRHGIGHIEQMRSDLEIWMRDHQYENLAAFRGKVARQRATDPWHFERGQYIKAVVGFD